MALDVYTKVCAKNVSGNLNKVYFAKASSVSSVTLTSGEISAITMAVGFQKYEADIDSVQFKLEGSGSSNYFTTQTLSMKFAKKTKELTDAIDDLAVDLPCGLVAIHVDGNGTAWLTGYDVEAKDPISRPLNQMKVTFDSGMKPSDEGGNQYTVELTRESEYENYPFDATLSAAIIAATTTVFAP